MAVGESNTTEWRRLLNDVDFARRELASCPPELRSIAEMRLDEANLRVIEFRRDLGNLFLFMARAATSEFPSDVVEVISRCVNAALLEDTRESVERLRADNLKLTSEINALKKRLNDIVTLWNDKAFSQQR